MKESPPEPSPTPEPTTPNLISTCTNLVTTLLDHHIPLTHHFKSKFTQLRTKLSTLQTHLSDLSDHPSPLSTTILTTLTTTLTSLSTLSTTCSLPTLPSGKLQTQSSLHSLSSLLDSHLHDLSLLLNDNINNNNNNNNINTLLEIGTVDSKLTALTTLLSTKDTSVISSSLPSLIRLLDSPNSQLKEKSAAAIAHVALNPATLPTLFPESLQLITHLSRLLDNSTPFAKQQALLSLSSLTTTKENSRAFASRGGISSLLDLSHSGTPSTAALAAGVLGNLAKFDDLKETFLEENAVGVLLSLSSSGTALARENAVGCLARLAYDDETMKVVIVREGGVEVLASYWDSVNVGKAVEVAVELLVNLASYTPFLEVLVEQGYGGRMMALLNCGGVSVRVCGARAVFELAGSGRARREMGESGCVGALVRMLDGKALEEREAAVRALARMVECGVCRKVFKKEERGVVATVELLDPLCKNVEKKWPVAVLAAVVGSKRCRKQMVAAGAGVYLHKLVELEVEGAKKLLDSIGKGKLWGVFARP